MQLPLENITLKNAMLKQVTIKQVTWQQAEAYLREIRTSVFIEEQFVTPEFEWDEIDHSAVHLLAMHEKQAIGCLRIIHHAKIGRMAVLKSWRGLGVGKMLLNEAIKICALQGSKQIDLSAQTHAVHFYQQAGFQVISDEYTDVQIPHVDMRLSLD
ncbi:MAG: GNAT family N-acetyltransferase [Pseudomonadota bacterium]